MKWKLEMLSLNSFFEDKSTASPSLFPFMLKSMHY